jgi:hypothetical protein
MKKVAYIVLVVLFSTTLFSCGVTKENNLKQKEEVTFTLKEKQEVMHRKIAQPQRTIIAAP